MTRTEDMRPAAPILATRPWIIGHHIVQDGDYPESVAESEGHRHRRLEAPNDRNRHNFPGGVNSRISETRDEYGFDPVLLGLLNRLDDVRRGENLVVVRLDRGRAPLKRDHVDLCFVVEKALALDQAHLIEVGAGDRNDDANSHSGAPFRDGSGVKSIRRKE